jgi:dephospho-CoA kinase
VLEIGGGEHQADGNRAPPDSDDRRSERREPVVGIVHADQAQPAQLLGAPSPTPIAQASGKVQCGRAADVAPGGMAQDGRAGCVGLSRGDVAVVVLGTRSVVVPRASVCVRASSKCDSSVTSVRWFKLWSAFRPERLNSRSVSVRENTGPRGESAYARQVLVVGLTGGIGSGKSTVSALLGEKGALIIDADVITREVQQPGHKVFDAMVERFGDGIVAADGSLDRPAVAAIVFADEAARKDLEAIVHPAVGAEMVERMQAVAGTDRIVVYDVPLLVESARKGYGAVVVVDVDPEIAVRRLVEQRHMDEADARARIANQASRADRLAAADRVIDNSGSLEELRRQVDDIWTWIESLPHP